MIVRISNYSLYTLNYNATTRLIDPLLAEFSYTPICLYTYVAAYVTDIETKWNCKVSAIEDVLLHKDVYGRLRTHVRAT